MMGYFHKGTNPAIINNSMLGFFSLKSLGVLTHGWVKYGNFLV